jgi:DNA primase
VNIAKKNQVVIVEGYTDVMACHLSGVDTAVASCGTAFGDEHARMLARLLGTGDVSGGEVIFTFDGDAAGQAAALKVFKGDHHFGSQTYVAVAPGGLDPCDLRTEQGEAAVRDLVARREPLYRFVMRNVIAGYDLDRADGRLAAVRAAAPLVSSIRDASLVLGYVRELAKLIGMDPEEVRREVKAAQARRPAAAESTAPVPDEVEPVRTALRPPSPNDRRLEAERATLRLILRSPEIFGEDWNQLQPEDFTDPAYATLFASVLSAADGADSWPQRVVAANPDPVLEQLVITLVVEPVLREPTPAYAAEYTALLRVQTLARQIAELKSKLQRTDPTADAKAYNTLFARLVGLEAQRRELLTIVTGPGL